MRSRQRFTSYAWAVLAANLLVILWGAFVRATGSGAGCGSNWPTCGGEVLPRSPSTETLIEFTHRLTSGVALLMVAALLIWAWRLFPPAHRVRQGAVLDPETGGAAAIISGHGIDAETDQFGYVQA